MAANNQTAVVDIILRGQQPQATLRDLERSARALRAQLSRLPMDSQEFANRSRDLAQINGRLRSIRQDLSGLGGMFQSIGREIKALGIIGAAMLAFTFIQTKITSMVKSNAELSDSLADIRKTTGMTVSEVEKLNTALGQINTRTSTKELRNIAIVGGQLGIAKGDILRFTGAVDKMNVALGDEFKGGAEEVTKAMGGLRNVFTDIKTDKVDQDMLHIGNAINELASKGAATGPVVADFANRIGGVGITLGLTSGQVLGLSATLQELNVNTERGGTAVTKILQRMTTNTAEFAKVAGMPVKEFTKLVNTDLFGAFTKVAEGSKKTGATATAFGKILDGLGVDGAGASEVFAKLGNNTAMLNEKVQLANTSLKSTDSIMAEFSTKNSTLAAEMERLSKGMNSAFTNSAVSNGLKTIVGFMADLFDKSKLASESMRDEQNTVNALLVEIKSANTTNERRVEIYEELKAISPDIVEGIDKENISLAALTNNVEKYNEAQINRIVIQKKQEEIDEANENAAEKKTELANASSAAYEKLAKIQQMTSASSLQYRKILDDENLSIDKKIKLLYETAQANIWYKDSEGNTRRNKEAESIANLAGSASKMVYWEQQYTKAADAANKLVSEKDKLLKDLGFTEKKSYDFSKKSEIELNAIIKAHVDSRYQYGKEAAEAAKIELLKRQKEKAAGVIQIDEEEAKKRADLYKKLLEDLAKLEREHELLKMSADDREIAKIHDKYDELRKQAQNHSKELKRINALEDDDLMNQMIASFEKHAALETKEYYERINRYRNLAKEKEEIENRSSGLKNLSEAEKYAEETRKINKEYDKRISDADAHNAMLLAGEEKYSIDILPIYMERFKALEDLNRAYEDRIDAETRTRSQQRLSAAKEVYNVLADLIQANSDYKTNIENAQLRDDEKRNDQAKTNLKRQLDQNLINEAEYNQRISKMDQEAQQRELEVKKQQFAREKKANTIQALINTFMAVSKANTATPYPPINAVLMGLSLAAGMKQVEAIQSQPEPYAKGGFTRRSDDPQGYTAGATLYSNSASGRPFIAGEAGREWIAPSWMVQNPVTADIISTLEAVRQRKFAIGGSTGATLPVQVNKAQNQVYSAQGFAEMAAVLSSLNSTLQNIQDQGIAAYINYDLMLKTTNDFDSAKAAAQVRT